MSEETPSPEQKHPTRRKFLRRAVRGCLYGGTAALGYAYAIEPHWIDVVRRPLPIANLPEKLVGSRLVQVSDIHIGGTVSDSYMRQALAGLAELQPDMIAMTGDYMTSEGDDQVGHALEILESLPRTNLGTYAVLGNHDYGRSGSFWRTARRFSAGLRDLGIEVLRNDVVEVEGLQIAGLDEFLFERCMTKLTLQQLDADRAMLTLCHNPDAVDKPGWEDFQGWILAGHTHGGQCKLPGFNPPITPVFNKRYTSGEFQLTGNRRMYINRGLGYLRRVRFNCRPEVTLFTLQQAAEA